VEPRRWLQLVSLIAAAFTSAVILFRFCVAQNGKCKKFLIAPLLYLGHVSFFYLCVFLDVANIIDITFFSSWSAGVTLHSIITLSVMSYIIYKQSKWLIG